jgi:hypothetical protein
LRRRAEHRSEVAAPALRSRRRAVVATFSEGYLLFGASAATLV